MNKLKSFFVGILLLEITFATVFFAVLVYRANNQTTVRTYIFQMNNSPTQRVGPLQDATTMKPEWLRNKLIQKYVAEYFKVIPVDKNTSQNATIRKMSTPDVYSEWLNGEAKTIKDMAENKMFRNVWVDPTNIKPTGEPNWFEVPYATRTWYESNNMTSTVMDNFGTVLLYVRFGPEVFRQNINIKKSLEKGDNPAMLFKFRVDAVRQL